MKWVWLIRHGESTAQAHRRHENDPSLSPRGEQQARALAAVLGGESFDEAWISPLRRTRQTFELSGVRAMRRRLDSRLVECRFDVDYAAMQPYECGRGYDAEADRHDAWCLPAGRRAQAVLAELRGCDAERIVLCTHWGFCSLLLSALAGGPVPEELHKGAIAFCAPLANAAFAVLALGHPKFGDCVYLWNEHRHVAHLLDGPLNW